MSDFPELILASTSPYRRDLLARLGLPFRCEAPGIDETRRPTETAEAYVARLALAKARAVAERHPQAWVIGSDQACVLDERVLGKPGDRAAAFAQLRASSGRWLGLRTAVALLRGHGDAGRVCVEPFDLEFRELSDSEIHAYLDREQPYDCAGSFKAEALGICLFRQLRGRDFNTVVGLPLIALLDLLREAGLNPLLSHAPGPD